MGLGAHLPRFITPIDVCLGVEEEAHNLEVALERRRTKQRPGVVISRVQADHRVGLVACGGRLEAGAVIEEEAHDLDVPVLHGEAEGPRLAAI